MQIKVTTKHTHNVNSLLPGRSLSPPLAMRSTHALWSRALVLLIRIFDQLFKYTIRSKQRRTNLQYKPQALQLSSSLRPRRQRGVWVAPQFEHSALTPPGAELELLGACEVGWRRTAGLRLVAVAARPEERFALGLVCVRTVRAGLPVGVLARLLANILDGEIVCGRTSLTACERGGTAERVLVENRS